MLNDQRRILVVGCSGAGKSTLSRHIGTVLGLPVIHLDQHFWEPGWVPSDEQSWERKLETLLREPNWVMDGGYHATLPRRMRRADVVVFLDLPRRVCLARVLRRIAVGIGRTRPDLAPGCPEKLDGEFLRWIWHWPRDVRPQVVRALAGARSDLPVITLRSAREVAEYRRRALRDWGHEVAYSLDPDGHVLAFARDPGDS